MQKYIANGGAEKQNNNLNHQENKLQTRCIRFQQSQIHWTSVVLYSSLWSLHRVLVVQKLQSWNSLAHLIFGLKNEFLMSDFTACSACLIQSQPLMELVGSISKAGCYYIWGYKFFRCCLMHASHSYIECEEQPRSLMCSHHRKPNPTSCLGDKNITAHLHSWDFTVLFWI